MEQNTKQYPKVPKMEMTGEQMEAVWMGNVQPVMAIAAQAGRYDVVLGALLAVQAMFEVTGSQDPLIATFLNCKSINDQNTMRAIQGTQEMMNEVGLTRELYESVKPRLHEILQKQQTAVQEQLNKAKH